MSNNTLLEQKDYSNLSDTEKYLIVHIDKYTFGINVKDLQDILKPFEITFIPLSPPHVAGSLNLRGRIVTALDLSYLLGLGKTQNVSSHMSIVAEKENELFSLLIDSVGDVIDLPTSKMDPNPDNLNEQWKNLSKGVFQLQEELLIVLDVNKVICTSQE